MKMRLTELRKIIRNTILETYEEDEKVYADTVLPNEQADEELIAEPDLTDQKERDSYLDKKEKSKKKKDRLRSADEIDDALGDEHAIVGAIGPLGSGNGPGTKPYGKQKKLKPKNAMGPRMKSIKESLSQADHVSAKERLDQIHRTKHLTKKLIPLLCDGSVESIYQAIELGGPSGVELLTLKKSWETSYDQKFVFQFGREFGNLLVQHLRKTSQNPFRSHSYTPFFKDEKGTWSFSSEYDEVTISIDK